MPRNRPELDRDRKIADILDVAERRLREDGYEALSIAAIGRELGVAPNSIYWYFASKDDLFIGALQHLLSGVAARKPPGRRALESRVMWFVEQLDEIEHLRVALYDRARASPRVAEFASDLDRASRQMLYNTLAGAVPDDERDIASQALLAAIQGATLAGLRGRKRRRVVGYTLRRFTEDTRSSAG